MFKLTEIKELIHAIDKSSIDELMIKGDGKAQLTIRKHPQGQTSLVSPVATPIPSAVVPQKAVDVSQEAAPIQKEERPEEQDTNLHKVVSPMVGTFYAAPSPDADAYVKVGDKVKTDTVVCIVEAMKLMNELEAEVQGEIVEILVENGQLVEYGQALFVVKLG